MMSNDTKITVYRLHTAKRWLREEIREMDAAIAEDDMAMYVDGWFDAAGVVLAALDVIGPNRARLGLAGWMAAQRDRARSLDTSWSSTIISHVQGCDVDRSAVAARLLDSRYQVYKDREGGNSSPDKERGK